MGIYGRYNYLYGLRRLSGHLRRVVPVALSLLLLSQLVVSPVYALIKQWDFSNPTDYIFDSSKIEFASEQVQLSTKGNPSWYDSAWTKRKPIVIDNTTGENTLTDYVLEMSIGYESGMQTEFGDIRFTDADGVTLISHWREEYSVSSSAKYYVKVPSISAYSEQSIYMYYGNPDAEDASSGEDTFIYYDGFERKGFENAASHLDIPTYEGSGQAIHPDVLYFPDGWNGHRYWMAFTPYPNSNDIYEDPSIVVSDDNETWVVPEGLTNPIDTKPAQGYNADTELVYNDTTDELYLYYMQYNSNPAVNTVYMMFTKSADGVSWTEPTSLLSWDLDDIADNERSYTIIKQGDEWHYWAQTNLTSVAPHRVTYRSSSDGLVWSAPVGVTFSNAPSLWHLNVEYIPSKSEYWMIYNSNTIGGAMYFAKSTDRLNWTHYPLPIISLGDTGQWDDNTIYRPSFIYDEASDLVRVWYSARAASGQWHTGYTEKGSQEILNVVDNGGWSTHSAFMLVDSEVKRGEYSGRIMNIGSSVLSFSDSSLQDVYIEGDFYDNMDNSGLALLRTWNSLGSKVGVGYHTASSPDHYVFHSLNFSYYVSQIERSLGWHKLGIRVNSDGTVRFYVDGQEAGRISGTGSISNARSVEVVTQTATAYYDDVRIRPFAPNAPSYLEGEEELLYSVDSPTIIPVHAISQSFAKLIGFSESATKNGGEIKYQISSDGGETWYWFSDEWSVTTAGYAEANTAAEINADITTLPIGNRSILVKAYLHSNGTQQVQLKSVTLAYTLSQSIPHLTLQRNKQFIDPVGIVLAGTAPAYATVEVRVYSTEQVGVVTANGNGDWFWSPPNRLEPGEHRYIARLLVDGEYGPYTDPVYFRVLDTSVGTGSYNLEGNGAVSSEDGEISEAEDDKKTDGESGTGAGSLENSIRLDTNNETLDTKSRSHFVWWSLLGLLIVGVSLFLVFRRKEKLP